MKYKIINSDSLFYMQNFMLDNSVDSVITDPPYGLNFMGKNWDKPDNIAFTEEFWKEVFRVLKPGGHVVSFGGSRTYHWLAIAIEKAGFEIRDSLMWIFGCLSEDTEILTEKGWKTYKTIEKDDIVFSMNLLKNTLSKSGINHIFEYHHNGKMVNLLNDNTDQLLTLNHKVIAKQQPKIREPKPTHYTYVDAGQIDSRKIDLPLASYYDGNLSIGGDFAEILGFILTDGSFDKSGNGVRIHQVKKHVISRIKYALGRANIPYKLYKREREYPTQIMGNNVNKTGIYEENSFFISGEWGQKIRDLIPNKKPNTKLFELTLVEKSRLLNGLMLGDGGIKGNDFYSSDINTLEWFQIFCHIQGIQARINLNKMCIAMHFNNRTELQGKHNPNRLIDYNGIVWCVNTDKGNFIARRNGKVFITGNSGFPKSSNISLAVDKKLGLQGQRSSKKSNSFLSQNIDTSRKVETGDYSYFGEKGSYSNPKSIDSKKWEGWGTQLKPAFEPIVLARKPISEKTIVDNILKWGVGAINIDESRIPFLNGDQTSIAGKEHIRGKNQVTTLGQNQVASTQNDKGRWPANIILDNSEEVSTMLDTQSGISKSQGGRIGKKEQTGVGIQVVAGIYEKGNPGFNDIGGASRFFYKAKASTKDREEGCEELLEKLPASVTDFRPTILSNPENWNGGEKVDNPMLRTTSRKNNHPTVKPTDLMMYLIRLITPKGGVILDPFNGSGSTGKAAMKLNKEGKDYTYIGIEMDENYCEISKKRIEFIGE